MGVVSLIVSVKVSALTPEVVAKAPLKKAELFRGTHGLAKEAWETECLLG